MPALAAAVSSAAELIGASTGDCVPVTNATTGITTVLAALNLAPGDAIITLSSAYSAVKTAIGRCAAAAGASVLEIELDMEVLQPIHCSLLHFNLSFVPAVLLSIRIRCMLARYKFTAQALYLQNDVFVQSGFIGLDLHCI